MKSNAPLKTVGPQMARLLAALYDRSQSTFTLADVGEITGLSPKLASSLIRKAVNRGLISRLKGGLFVIVPPELGSTREYPGNPLCSAKNRSGTHAATFSIQYSWWRPPRIAVLRTL